MFEVSRFLNPARRPHLAGHQSVQDAFCLMSKYRLTEIPVVNKDGQVTGAVDLFELLKYLLRMVPDRLPIPDSCYQNTLNTINENEPIRNAAYFPVDRVVLAPTGKLRGVLTRADVVRGLMQEIEVLHFALNQLDTGIAVLAMTGDLLYANRAFRRATGLDGASPGVVPFTEVVDGVPPPAELEESPVRYQRYNNGTCWTLEYHLVRSGMQPLAIMVRLSVKLQDASHAEPVSPPESDRYTSAVREVQAKMPDVVIASKKMKHVLDLALRAARTSSAVLITGETGVGKEVVAEIIHRLGSRSHKPLVKLNCAAIPDTLMEAELFGYEKGAFTGAAREGKIGLIEAANGGTLFLDEITELPTRLQAKLLRFLQNGEFYKLGSTRPHRVDVRIIAATNCCNVEKLVEQGSFRRDLYYRLCVIPIHVPALRERPEDIIPLALHFLRNYCRTYGVNKEFSSAVLSALQRYPWPGNVRELQHLVERLVILSDSPLIREDDLPPALTQSTPQTTKIEVRVRGLLPLREAYKILEYELLRYALQTCASARQIAKELAVDHSTILRKINRYKARSIQQQSGDGASRAW